MQTKRVVQIASLAALGAILAAPALAQGAKNPPPAPPSTWSQTVTKEKGVEGQEFDAKQLDLIQKINVYFNLMGEMKGAFVQTSADQKRLRGKVYFKRPGQFRFEYNLPSRQLIISDGKYIAIQDHDLKTDDRPSIDNTPFRVLLRKEVDLLRDARILEVGESEDRIFLALQDKNPDTQGQIKLFLQKRPTPELKEWITTDSQGLATRVELVEFAKTEGLDPNLFVPPPIALQKLQQ
jgi:outer membrane lipoprotein-sorting protein